MEENEEVVEEVNENNTSEEVVENQKQDTKTYTEEEVEAIKEQMKADNQKAWDKRWGREKTKLEKAYSEKDELINLLMEQTGKKNIQDLLDMSYEEYGVERPNVTNSRDEEILGKHDAQEILDLGLDNDLLEEEVSRLASIQKRSAREQATYTELDNYLTNQKEKEKRNKEIKESGIDESVLDNQDFKDFMSKFNKDTKISDIYDIYSKTQGTETKKKPFSAGSLNGKQVKEDSEFFTEEEFMSLTAEDLDNPKIYEKAMKSRLLFK